MCTYTKVIHILSLSPNGSHDIIHSAFIFVFFYREYDNLKGSLKSSNDICEKLRREVLFSSNKVTLSVKHQKCCIVTVKINISGVFCVALVTKNHSGPESD